jgi:hypothetical protein
MKITMKRFVAVSPAIAALIGLMTVAALAANPHFLEGPTFRITGKGALEVTGTIAGVGNQDLTIVLTATGQRTCTNRGGNQPPGQDQTVSGSVSNLQPKNGRVTFDVTTSPVPNTCPDNMASFVTFSTATLTVIQDNQTVFEQTFTF